MKNKYIKQFVDGKMVQNKYYKTPKNQYQRQCQRLYKRTSSSRYRNNNTYKVNKQERNKKARQWYARKRHDQLKMCYCSYQQCWASYSQKEINKITKNIQYLKQYRKQNKQILNEKKRQSYYKNRQERCMKQRQYGKKNRQKINKKQRQRQKLRMKNDPMFRAKKLVVDNIRKSLKKAGFKKENHNTNKILGCSYKVFYDFIQSKFQQGMSWNNKLEWHYDHVVAISSFTLQQKDLTFC